MQKGFQDKQLKVLYAKVDAAQGAVGVSLVVLAEAHEQRAIAVQAAAEADVVKDAAVVKDACIRAGPYCPTAARTTSRSAFSSADTCCRAKPCATAARMNSRSAFSSADA